MRIAVLADIHANLPALEAVLAEPDVTSADRVVLLGDIALGPMPAESLDLLSALGERAVWVHSNCEREIVAAYDAREHRAPAQSVAQHPAAGRHVEESEGPTMAKAEVSKPPAARASAAPLQPHHRDLLDGVPMTVTLDVDGLGPVLSCHATPRRDDEVVLVDSPMTRWVDVLHGVAEPTVVLGHTHMPFDRLVDRRRVVNPGSVGMAYGASGACWALLGTLGSPVQLRRTAYDVNRAAARIAASSYEGADSWAQDYVLAPPRMPRHSRSSPA